MHDDGLEHIRKLLAEEIAPALELDGAAIEVVDLQDGILSLRLGEVCTSCPNTLMTVLMGLEQELTQRIPEVQYLEAVP